MSQKFELIVFTASVEQYALDIVQALDKERSFISHVFSRKHCFFVNECFLKDLRLIKNRNLNNIILIDDFIVSAAFQISNLLPCKPFQGDRDDVELMELSLKLIDLQKASDIRVYLENAFHLQYFVNNSKKE